MKRQCFEKFDILFLIIISHISHVFNLPAWMLNILNSLATQQQQQQQQKACKMFSIFFLFIYWILQKFCQPHICTSNYCSFAPSYSVNCYPSTSSKKHITFIAVAILQSNYHTNATKRAQRKWGDAQLLSTLKSWFIKARERIEIHIDEKKVGNARYEWILYLIWLYLLSLVLLMQC